VTLADIHRKLEGTNLTDRSEDLLTSNIFGCLRYVPPKKVLLPFLETSQSLSGKHLPRLDSVCRVHCSFWPSLRSIGHAACQPDVVLGLETEDNLIHLVMVEAKYLSGPSSEENDENLPHHQLGRELDQLFTVSPSTLHWETTLEIATRSLIYVTMDFSIPKDDIERACREYSSKRGRNAKIYWTSWRSLPAILESCLVSETIEEFRMVMEDMLYLLEKKWLILFSGVDPITKHFRLPDFYQVSVSSYDWPDMAVVSHLSYSYRLSSTTYEWPSINLPPSFYYEPRVDSHI
jgi:hypothetical protein